MIIRPDNHDLKELEDAVIDAKRIERGINAVARQAISRTYKEMYSEPLKVRPFHRYFAPWCSRTSFYNLLNNKGGVSVEKAIGLLVSDRELRIAVGLEPDNILEEESWVIRRLILLAGAKGSLLEWLHTTLSSDTSTAPPPPSGITDSEPNSSVSSPKPSQLVNATSELGSRSINGKRHS